MTLPRPTPRLGSLQPIVLVLAGVCAGALAAPAPTTLNDFFGPGTQPGGLAVGIESWTRCSGCHGGYDAVHEPFRPWISSPMGQTMRDPMFRACLTIANQDAAFAGDLCLRCHTPQGWLAGRSTPTDGSALLTADYEGVNCNFCHRMVDPWQSTGINPPDDATILANLADMPVNPHSGQFVIDPQDRRRGPFDLDNFNSHEWRQSSYYADSSNCAMCHDVSNPAFSRQPDGTYALNDLDTPHPTQDKFDMFPIERTYSEWSASAFAQGPIEMGGRFGGNITAVSSCQDCHMPDGTGRGCNRSSRPIRDNLPKHEFNGGNTWIVEAIRLLYPDSETGLDAASVNASVARAVGMLEAASDLTLWQEDDELYARVTNQTGHKLPSGYPEGRRIWLNVRFFDAGGAMLMERGAYDPVTATLVTTDTTVYEAKIGVDAAVSAVTGIPEGPGFHFAVANTWYKDNRIPPRGFTNAGFEAVQAAPVGHGYDDGQYWDDSEYTIPSGATRAEVRVYYQLASKEYIEFLRDENETDDTGETLHTLWAATGKSAPVLMDFAELALASTGGCNAADLAQPYGVLDLADINAFVAGFLGQSPIADLNGDTIFDLRDLNLFVTNFLAGCP